MKYLWLLLLTVFLIPVTQSVMAQNATSQPNPIIQGLEKLFGGGKPANKTATQAGQAANKTATQQTGMGSIHQLKTLGIGETQKLIQNKTPIGPTNKSVGKEMAKESKIPPPTSTAKPTSNATSNKTTE